MLTGTHCARYLAVSLCLVFFSLSDLGRAQLATIISVEGQVERWADADPDRKFRAQEKDTLAQADWLRTGAASTAGVQLHQEDSVKVSEQTTIQVAELRRAGRQGRTSALDLRLGEVFCKVGKLKRDRDSFEVRTPTATAAVRGTRFAVAYTVPEGATAGITTVRVWEGLVEVTVADAEKSITVREGEELAIDERGTVLESGPVGELPAEFETSAAGPTTETGAALLGDGGASILDALDNAARDADQAISGEAGGGNQDQIDQRGGAEPMDDVDDF